eukprot:CAMPEP_0178413764 /NCGR_PEP_ID=MMETSP0689_2-20121128/22694_1 /TAXON_ID=160604 /ORGANISM="Amphidinium massartii, Strain CS-259" /LENGTH=319 /DNA_ID=CAMNT_0020035043 /DNA_START=90 /DNA_END=1049 /DNA_ORIENTATION=+
MGRCSSLAAAAALSTLSSGVLAAENGFVQASSATSAPRTSLRSASSRVGEIGANEVPASSQASASASTLQRAATAVTAAVLAGMTMRSQRCSSGIAMAAKKGKGGKGGKGGKAKGGGGAGGGAAVATADEETEVDTASIMNEADSKMANSLTVLQDALMGIRAGKASPGLISGVKVNAYGADQTLQELATITATDNRTLMVSCFDESTAPAVEKGMIAAGLGFGISPNGANIKVSIPELTTDKRQQYVKIAKDAAEKSRLAIRNVRQQTMKKIKGFEKKKSISEDMSKALQAEVETMVKKHVGDIDKTAKAKEEEILKV